MIVLIYCTYKLAEGKMSNASTSLWSVKKNRCPVEVFYAFVITPDNMRILLGISPGLVEKSWWCRATDFSSGPRTSSLESWYSILRARL